ncbi:PucR family transcriptional regulator [Actinophytocola sp.]|uniref:PucR family transcriptional regulator n=1 Tax=Actinophytocola sp. TaxID=1872138 RepID=UPI002ED7B885
MTEPAGESSMRGAEPVPPASAVITGLSRQNSLYRRMITICDQVADAAVRGADARQLTRVLAATLDQAVLLFDPAFTLLAEAGAGAAEWNPDDVTVGRMLRALATERRPLRLPAMPDSSLAHGCQATPVTIGDTTLGYLVVLDRAARPDQADDADLLTTSYAATLFALTLANERTSTDLGQRYQGAIVDALVSGNFLDGADASRKALSLGLADPQPYRIAVLRPGAADESPGVADELAGSLAAGGLLAVARGAEVVLILREAGRELADRVLADGRKLSRHKATCGLSELADRPAQAPVALRQAQHAIDVGTRIGRADQVIPYEELGIYRLLLQIGDMRQLWRFAEEILGPLLEYDASHKVDLVATLSTYLNQHESLKQAARALRVHVNTVSYRIQRIEQLTPLDLTNPDDRLVAHVAVKIVESRRAVDRMTTGHETGS